MGKKSKKNKKTVELKTKDDRQAFVYTIKEKLANLGIDSEVYTSIKELHEIMEEYIESGNSTSGKIKFPEAHRTIEYVLSNRKHIQGYVTLVSGNNK